MPRPNGYQSLHTSVISERGVPFEVQIRTEEMHAQAEEGIAAHWKYKEGRVGDQRDERYFQWMRQLLEWQQEVRDPQEFIQNLKIDLYPEEVYIFTPKGEVKALPAGRHARRLRLRDPHRRRPPAASARASTARWCRCARACKNGDIVEIVTQAGHKPSRDWLNFVVTSRARNKIQPLRAGGGAGAQHRARPPKLFEKEARRFDLNPKTLLESEAFAKFAEEYGGGKADELLAAIGYGKLPPTHGARQARAGRSSCRRRRPDGQVVSAVKRVLRLRVRTRSR